MACTSCSTSDGGAPKGCKNNGTCGTDSCNKLTVFDWLSNMSAPNGETPFDCVEVRFKNGRKDYLRTYLLIIRNSIFTQFILKLCDIFCGAFLFFFFLILFNILFFILNF
jgi:hypothetical protein